MGTANRKAAALAGAAASKNTILRPNFNGNRRLAQQHAQSFDQAAAAYEKNKAAWIEQHPDASSVEYNAAMIRIARECGV
jgi:hypothetical protein